jgi:hypothetical protein
MLLIGLLVVGIAMLSGCGLLDYISDGIAEILDAITGSGGTTSSVYPISGRMGFSLAATVFQNNGYTPISSSVGTIGTTFWSGAGTPGGCFTAMWDGGDFSGTSFLACLSEDEKTVTRFSAMQIQANVWGGYTYMHSIEGVNVPFSHIEGNSRYYVAEGTGVRTLVSSVDFSMWVPGAGGSISNPLEWIAGGIGALTGSVNDVISIRLDYQNAAVAP